jgi:hypothetical protein
VLHLLLVADPLAAAKHKSFIYDGQKVIREEDESG